MFLELSSYPHNCEAPVLFKYLLTFFSPGPSLWIHLLGTRSTWTARNIEFLGVPAAFNHSHLKMPFFRPFIFSKTAPCFGPSGSDLPKTSHALWGALGAACAIQLSGPRWFSPRLRGLAPFERRPLAPPYQSSSLAFPGPPPQFFYFVLTAASPRSLPLPPPSRAGCHPRHQFHDGFPYFGGCKEGLSSLNSSN